MVRMALATLGALLVLSVPASAASPPPSRLEGKFDMQGKITKTKRIAGEKKGQQVFRNWTFAPKCASGVCEKIKLTRSLADFKTEKVELKWDGKKYSYERTRKVTGVCGGKNVKKADKVTVKISATVTETIQRKGVPESTKVDAKFGADHKVTCPGGSLTAMTRTSFKGTRAFVPMPPEVAFDWVGGGNMQAGANVEFFDESFDDTGQSGLWKFQWDFGDGGTSTERSPDHTYASPGTYTVTLAVTDADDMTGNASRSITIDP